MKVAQVPPPTRAARHRVLIAGCSGAGRCASLRNSPRELPSHSLRNTRMAHWVSLIPMTATRGGNDWGRQDRVHRTKASLAASLLLERE